MKHVFIINSHTTYLTVMGTLDYLKLGDKDVLLILVRNYTNKYICKSIETIDASLLSYESEKVFNRRNFLPAPKKRFIEKVEQFVDEVIGTSFHLYAPHLAHPLWTILYTNKQCLMFSYLQEGLVPFTSAYVVKTPLKGLVENYFYDKVTSGRVWFYRPWYLKDHIDDDKGLDAFAINDKFFKFLPAKTTIIHWPLPEQDINVEFESEHKIFVYDAYVAHHIMESNDYLEVCKELIDEEASANNYLKFHPGQSKREIEAIIQYFEMRKLHYNILDNSIPFEYIIMTKKNLRLTGYGSTLLFLAHDYGHQVSCKDDRLLKYKLYRRFRRTCGFMSFNEYINHK